MVASDSALIHPPTATRKHDRASRCSRLKYAALCIGLLAILVLVMLSTYGDTTVQHVSLNRDAQERAPDTGAVVPKRRIQQQGNSTRSKVLAVLGTCADWTSSSSEWNVPSGVLQLAAQYGFRRQTFSQLQPMTQRIAFVKIHKTGSTTFSSMIYNGANRRRNLVLVRRIVDQCRMRINIPVNMKSPPSPVAVEFSVNHVAVEHKKQKAHPTLLHDWYTKQMNGRDGEGEALGPIRMMSSFRDPLKRLQSYFTFFVLQHRKHASFGAWVMSLKLNTIPSYAQFFGVKSEPELRIWWEATGQHIIWLSQENMADSASLLQFHTGLELFELASLRTQSGYTRANHYANMWNVSTSSLMEISGKQLAHAKTLLSLDYILAALVHAQFNASMSMLWDSVGPTVLQEQQTMVSRLSAFMEQRCDMTVMYPLQKEKRNNCSNLPAEFIAAEPVDGTCRALGVAIVSRQKWEVPNSGVLPVELACQEEMGWREIFEHFAAAST